jgi:hypothetical protein
MTNLKVGTKIKLLSAIRVGNKTEDVLNLIAQVKILNTEVDNTILLYFGENEGSNWYYADSLKYETL